MYMSNLKSLSLCILIISIFAVANAQTSDWSWAVKAGGPNIDAAADIAVDSNGNSYVTGQFSDSITIGSTTLTSTANQDVYIAKASPSGNWLWARKAGGNNADDANSVAVDAAGNVYIIGNFNSSTIYFGNIAVNRFPNSSSNDLFVAKLDPNGNWLWARGLGGIMTDVGMCIAVDANSDIYITGSFRSSVTVPTSPSTTFTSFGYTDVIVAKLNSSGTWLWARQAGGSETDYGNGISLDSNGNVYVAGSFISTSFSLGNIVINNSGTLYDAFVAKIDPNGNWLWARAAGGSCADMAYAVAVDPQDNPVITGSIGGQAFFGPFTLTLTGFYDIFVAKLDPSGNWLWASKAGGTDWDEGLAVDTDVNSNIYLTGRFRSTCYFGSLAVTSFDPLETDGFVAKMSPSGIWLDVTQTGGLGADCGKGIALDNASNIHTCGDFCGSAEFGPYTLNSSGYSDVYLAKMSNTSVQLELVSPNGGEIWYNNSTHAITWTSSNITNILLDYSLNNGSSWNQITTSPIAASPGTYNWTIPNLNSTQVLVRVKDSDDNNVYDVSDDVFTVMDEPSPPVADFSADVTSGYEPLTVQFSDESVPGSGTITSWSWNFGDGDTSAEQNPEHTYQNDGVYDVSLMVTNSNSLTDELVLDEYINVLATNPEITLLTSQSIEFGEVYVDSTSTYQDVQLENTGTADLIINDIHFTGNPLHFEFVMPNRNIILTPGEIVSIPVCFTPQAEGELTDVLYFENNSTNNPSLEISLSGIGIAIHYPPEADFTADVTSGPAPLAVQFTDLSEAVSGIITNWNWSFGDGGTSTLQNPQHIYELPGIYDVCLTVTNSYDLSSIITLDDYITVQLPTGNLNLLSGSQLDFGSSYINISTDFQPVILSNSGSAAVNISNIHFIGNPLHFEYRVDDNALLINPGETDSIFVRFIPLVEGALNDTLYIVNDSPNAPLLWVCLSGNGTIPPPTPPQNVLLDITDEDVQLDWEAVSTNVLGDPIMIDHYAIFTNESADPIGEFSYHDRTSETSYTHNSALAMSNKMLYKIYAVEMFPDTRDIDEETRLEVDRFLRENLVSGMTEAEFNQVLREAEKLVD